MLSSTIARRVAGVTLAGALFAVPLGALAGTASAADQDVAQVQTVAAQAAPDPQQIDREHRRDDERPDDGPRVQFHQRQDAPDVFRQLVPSTGSAL